MRRWQHLWRLLTAVLLVFCVTSDFASFHSPRQVSAQQRTLIWTALETPGIDPFSVISPSEVSYFALHSDSSGGVTIYLSDIPNSRLLKRSGDGSAWISLLEPLQTAGALPPVYLVAVAPDNADIVVAVTNSRKRVYYSANGGLNWTSTGLENLVPPLGANEQISGIEVSPVYRTGRGDARDVVICTRDSTPARGRVLVLQLLPIGVAVWTDQTAPAQSYSCIRLSPNYASDPCIVVVGSDATDTFVNIGVRDLVANTTRWNGAVIPGWPVDISGSVAGPNWTELVTADIFLPDDFYGGLDFYRRLYLCFDDGNATGLAGVYFVESQLVYSLNFPAPRPYCLAGKGSHWNVRLMCSAVTGASLEGVVPVYYCAYPSISGGSVWTRPNKYPTGAFGSNQARTTVRWSKTGDKAYAGSFSTLAIDSAADWYVAANWTTGKANDESALSVSTDEGLTWNQVGYIDTTISGLNDFAVSSDGSTAYLTSWNSGINLESVWRTRSKPLGDTWERIACFPSVVDQPIIRLVSESLDGSVVFWADVGGRRIHRSVDYGQTWQDTQSNLTVQDLAVVDASTAYVLQNDGRVARGSNRVYDTDIWVWTSPVRSGVNVAHTIAVSGNVVVVGGSLGGGVAYSLDGGRSFRVTPDLPTTGNQHVAIDPAFHETRCIYVADDSAGGQVYRWYVGTSVDWRDGIISGTVGPRFGVVVTSESTQFGPALYCPLALVGGWVVERTLYSRVSPVREARQSWDYLMVGLPFGVTFSSEPSALKVSGKSPNVVIWAVDTSANRVFLFNDSLTLDSPSIISPKADEKSGVAAVPSGPDGFNAAFGVSWDVVRTSSEYEVQVATSPDFSTIVAKAPWSPPGPPFYVPANPERPSWLVAAGTLASGQTYYVRVRVRRVVSGQVIRTVWSPPQKLTLQLSLPLAADYAGPRAIHPPVGSLDQPFENLVFSWTPIAGATEYRFVLSREPSFATPLVDTPVGSTSFCCNSSLDAGRTYFWQVWATKPVPSQKSPIFVFTTRDAELVMRGSESDSDAFMTGGALIVTLPSGEDTSQVWVWVLIPVLAVLLLVVVVLSIILRPGQ